MAILGPRYRKDGTRYYSIVFRDREKREVRLFGGHTKKDAQTKLGRVKAEVREGTWIHPDDVGKIEGPTFSEFADRFLDDYGSLRRSDYYEQAVGVLKDHFKDRPLREITRADLDWFATKRGQKVSNATLRKNLTALGTLFKMAVRWDVLASNPASDLQKPGDSQGRMDYLTEDQFGELVKAAPPWIRNMHRLAVSTGLRLKEVTGLRWEDVDLRGGVLYINPDSKQARQDAVPLSAEARAVLTEQTARRAQVGRELQRVLLYVFTNDAGEDYNAERERNRITKVTKAVMATIGRPSCSFHTLRHTCASWMVQRGVDLKQVKDFMRHRNVQTTIRYAHLAPEHLGAAVAALDSAISNADVLLTVVNSEDPTSANLKKTNERL